MRIINTITKTNPLLVHAQGNTLKLYKDDVLKQTLTALTNSLKFQLIGHGHPTSTYGFRGTMDYFKIKNKQ